MYIRKEQRTEKVTMRISKSELKTLDALRDKHQNINKYWKVSRTDIILAAVRFANGEYFALNEVR